ncbi:MAG TPA: hypothetical protein VD971_05795 [Phycisphaerales bacterium]|nr:hypothetical protein [Phycisphaerales bacterium]
MLKALSMSAAVACLAGVAFGVGPDVTLQDIQSISTFGPVNGQYAYIVGSHTCNRGTSNLLWTNNGTPGLASNVYRLHNGRLMHLGLSHAKTACCAAAGGGPCGSCNGAGGSVLGAGCLDVYSSGWNSGQGRLAPRNRINPVSGVFSSYPQSTGNAIFRRAQVPVADMNATNFPGAIYFVEGVYVGTDDAQNNNENNNATYKRATLGANGVLSPTPVSGGAVEGVPAIRAWRDHGLGLNQPDPRVEIATLDVPGDGRFWVATKVTQNGPASWTYDYAIFNLSSDKSAGSLSLPIPSGVNITNVGFHAPDYHSDEPFSNADWVTARTDSSFGWSTPETFSQNANASALRWGTMYSFWFTADAPPASGNATLGLFKVNDGSSVTFAAPFPKCDTIDFNHDTLFPSNDDLEDFLAVFGGDTSCTTCGDIDFNNDGLFPDNNDISHFFAVYGGASCQ